MQFNAAELIKKKKTGGAHSAEEIRWLIQQYTKNEVPDYQMAAWAMAVWFKGMTDDEIAIFTESMKNSGKVFDLSNLTGPRIDKHSTGGVGDKTSLIIGPIVASAGINVPMIAGRGLGHTGGTLDKLESIPGFRVRLSREEFVQNLEHHRFSLMGQTEDICPADRKLYSLRDVTSTVDSLPLICGSIMSKKLAENLSGLVLDIKFGSGAFMKTVDDALALAQLLKTTGEKNGVPVSALITNMNQPLGRFVGNSVEIQECLEILEGKTCVEKGFDFYEPTRELSLHLSAHMLRLGQVVKTVEEGYERAKQLLQSGEALAAFHRLLHYQGPSDISQLPKAKYSMNVVAKRSGFISAIQTELVGLAGIELRAGRKLTSDNLDYSAGVECHVRIGSEVVANEKLFRIFSNTEADLNRAEELMQLAVQIEDAPPSENLPLILKVLT